VAKPEAAAPNVARAGGIMMASLLLSRVLGYARQIIIAGLFGQTVLTDAYVISFSIPDVIFYLVAGGALSSAFIPVFTEYLTNDKEDEAWHIFSALATLMTLIIGGFVVLAWIFTPQISAMVAPGKMQDPTAAAQILPLISFMGRIVLPAQLAFFLGGLMFGTLYAKGKFGVPGLGPNIYNIGIIIGAIVVSKFVTPGVVGMSWGALIGAFAGNIVVPIFAMKKIGAKFRPNLDTKHPGVRKVFKLMIPVVLGLSLPGVYTIIMRAYGSYYNHEGVNSALEMANQLMQAPLAIFGQSMALAVFPALSQYFAQGRMDMFRSQLSGTVRTTLFLGVPSAMILGFAAYPIVEAMLQHGAFGPDDTARTAIALQTFAVGIAAWCLHPVMMRGWFAIQKSLPPTIMGTGATVIFVGGCAWVTKMHLPYQYLPLVGSITSIILIIVLIATLAKQIGGFDVKGVVATFGKALLASIPTTLIFAGLMHLWAITGRHGGKFVLLLSILLLAGIAAWVYYLFAKLLKMPEVTYFDRMTARITKKNQPADG
jgi:putative peptidoglycan lipid II flippase